jgi:hypothetical protein
VFADPGLADREGAVPDYRGATADVILYQPMCVFRLAEECWWRRVARFLRVFIHCFRNESGALDEKRRTVARA